MINLTAKITGIKYTPLLYKKLDEYNFQDLHIALEKKANFFLKIDNQKLAISQWVSPKRTRSYPYGRVYDTLGFSGKKITIIPILKDEGKQGDRDFLQWDTVSLMSLLGVYVVIAYYDKAEKSKRYEHKITKQQFNIDYLKKEIKKLLSYQSDALHWNIECLNNVGKIGSMALKSYQNISTKLNVEMHSYKKAKKRIELLLQGRNEFMNLSRQLAEQAQRRESLTIQPKELVDGSKAILTISNYLGGHYYFTVDEVEIENNSIKLIEAKHSKTNNLPSLEDIKDGLVKMILFTNLKEVTTDKNKFSILPVLKLTTDKKFKKENLNEKQKELINKLTEEAKINKFDIHIH